MLIEKGSLNTALWQTTVIDHADDQSQNEDTAPG